MKIIKAPIIYPTDPLLETFEQYFFYGGFPTISEADNEEVIEMGVEVSVL
jgi:predicted AAA+ superfamily ATPase